MLTSSYLHAVGIILLPWLLRSGWNLLRRRPSKTDGEAPPDKQDMKQTIAQFIIVLGILYNIVLAIFFQPPNIVLALGLDAYAPTFLLRNTAREEAPQYWTYFTGVAPASIWQYSSLTNSGDTHNIEDHPEWVSIYSKMKTRASRQIYHTFGHDALLNCSFCQDRNDYIMYMLPDVILQYCLTAGLIGIISLIQRKRSWRTYGSIILAIPLIAELVSFYTSQGDTVDFLGFEVQYYCWASHIGRHVLFAGVLVLTLLIDTDNTRTYPEVIENVRKIQEFMIHRVRLMQ